MTCNPLLSEAFKQLGPSPHDIDTTDLVHVSDRNRRNITSALTQAVRDDRLYPLHDLPGLAKQNLVNKLFNYRGMGEDGIEVWGGWDDSIKVNRDHRGITTRMEPTAFLRLAASRGNSLFDRDAAKLDLQRNILDIYKDKKQPRLFPAILYFEEVGDNLQVVGHEGRHRANAIIEMLGYREIQIPVDIQIRDRRAERLTGEEWDKKLISEEGRDTGLTLGELFNKVGERHGM